MAQQRDEGLEEWVRSQPASITSDPVWRLACYRESLYVFALARDDAVRTRRNRPFGAVGEQLLRAVGSVSANIAEAYGRPTNRDRVRFLVFALGSAREAMTWYEGARTTLTREEVDDRLQRLARTRAMLVGLLRRIKQTDPTQRFERW